MILVDTDVLIAHLRGIPAARDWVITSRLQGPLAISAVTVTELTGSMRSNERHEVWALLGTLRVEPVTELIARRAGELMRTYRRGNIGIGLGDYLIGATVMTQGHKLATLNIKHFPMLPELVRPFTLDV